MKIVKTALAMLAFTFIGATLAPAARADEWNKKTVMTFSQSFEIPGRILPAGTYILKVVGMRSDRHMVQIFSTDGTQMIATILTIPNYRTEATNYTVVRFAERSGDNPEALKAWFYPGDKSGQEFIYRSQSSVQLSVASKKPVVAPANQTTDPNTAEVQVFIPARTN
jgi:hypothetical protein